ncbi:MAG: polyvinylalcohol dehydrogenase [Planctomycetota bacterium]|nr:MAG: polyvinylalcohol dehydrogenase [Planctomycetota bacterium]
MRRRLRLVVSFLLLVALLLSIFATTTMADRRRRDRRRPATRPVESAVWSQWRGPNRDGKSLETGLLASWSDGKPPLVWQAKDLGKGFSSVSIANGKVYTAGVRDGNSHIIALSEADGSELWATPIGEDSDVNGTPTVDHGKVYSIGFNGAMLCADAETGRALWRKDFATDFKGKMMSQWGFSESPLIDGNLLICTPGGNEAVMVALNKHTGRPVWRTELPNVGENGKDGAGYSSVVISNAAGRKQYVQLTGRGVVGVDARSGKLLWAYNRIANGVANIPTPIVSGDYVFCSTGYGTGAALLKIVRDGRSLKAEEVYFLEAGQMQNHHGGMILLDGHIFFGHGHNKGFPRCIHMETGEVKWEDRGPGKQSAAIAYADGHLYFRYENGVMALIEANADEYRLKGTFEIDSRHAQSWPHPVVAGGRLYLRDQHELHCYNIRAKGPSDSK